MSDVTLFIHVSFVYTLFTGQSAADEQETDRKCKESFLNDICIYCLCIDYLQFRVLEYDRILSYYPLIYIRC